MTYGIQHAPGHIETIPTSDAEAVLRVYGVDPQQMKHQYRATLAPVEVNVAGLTIVLW